ncbi:monocarboxylate transporter 3-like [Atheta coriaria]|uniref:monocarboxylate transporter 3-like n=1 Tax=Dalotia coriaria TaxID=877792 RepID=UPI0031F3B37E
MVTVNDTPEIQRDKYGRRYELLPPEGGWGYMVALAITTFFSVTIVPVGVFGMIFGGFLKTIGDETFGTTMTNAVFNFVLSGTGLVSNHMLQHYSCRKVGLAGAVIFFIGAFGTCYVNSLIQLIITWGVLQGFGLGLMMPACFTSFNGYFNKKQTFMMSGAQTLIAVIAMGYPFMIEKFNERFTWRETQFVVAGLSLHCFVAMISLQPVKWHMKKKYLEPNEAVLNSGHSHLEVPQVRSGNVTPRSLRVGNEIEPQPGVKIADAGSHRNAIRWMERELISNYGQRCEQFRRYSVEYYRVLKTGPWCFHLPTCGHRAAPPNRK